MELGDDDHVQAPDDAQIDASWIASPPPEAIARGWIAAIVEPPEGCVALEGLQDVGGAPHRNYREKTLGELKAEAKAELLAFAAGRIAAGFPAPQLGAGETLQVRSAQDLINWDGLYADAVAEIAAGRGGEPCEPPLRTTANHNFTPDWEATAALLQALKTWLKGEFKTRTGKADAIEAAEDAAQLAAVRAQLAEGWA